MPDCSYIAVEESGSVESLLAQLKESTNSEEPKRNVTRVAFLSDQGSLIVLLNGVGIYSLSGWKTTLRDGEEVSFLQMLAGA